MKFVLSLNEEKDYKDCGIIWLNFINEDIKNMKISLF